MNSNPIIGKEVVRSDQYQSEQVQVIPLEQEQNKKPDEENKSLQQSSSFVAIDLYGQDRSEYLYTSLFTGMIQVPILITIHELLTVRKQVNSYEIAYGIVAVQLLTMILYFVYKKHFFFDVPKEGRVPLLVRSLLYAISFTLFVRSMSFLNPVTALISQQAGIVVCENFIRFLYRQNVVINIIVVKISITICLLVPGWIPETCPVEPPLIEVKDGASGSVPPGDSKQEAQVDPDWMLDYRQHALEAFIAGCILCIVSRISHYLAKPGVLRHESYMSMYAYLVTACVMPLLILTSLKNWTEKREKHFLSDVTLTEKIVGFSVLFVLLMIKNWHMERGIMKRFVEDFDPAIHEHFPWKRARQEDGIQIEESNPPDSSRQGDQEEEVDFRGVMRRARDSMTMTDARYENHVQSQRRNTVNLACFQLLFITCVYVLTYEAGVDIEDDYDQPSLNYLPCFFAVWLISKPLALFSYFDDLILTY